MKQQAGLKFAASAGLLALGLSAGGSAHALPLTLPTSLMDATSVMALSEEAYDGMSAVGISMSSLGNAYQVAGITSSDGTVLPAFALPITEVSVNLGLFSGLTPTAGEAMGSALTVSRGSNSLVLANFQIDYSSEQVLADVIVSGVTTTGMAIYSFDAVDDLAISLNGLTLNMHQQLANLMLTTAAQDTFASALKLNKAVKGALSVLDFGTITIDINGALRKPVSATAFTAAMVPEPGPASMMGLGLLALMWVARRKLSN